MEVSQNLLQIEAVNSVFIFELSSDHILLSSTANVAQDKYNQGVPTTYSFQTSTVYLNYQVYFNGSFLSLSHYNISGTPDNTIFLVNAYAFTLPSGGFGLSVTAND